MRNRSWMFLPLALLLLTGCAAGTAVSNGNETEMAQQVAEMSGEMIPASTGGDLMAAQTEAQARLLTEDVVLAAYERAVDLYSWFDLAQLPSAEESPTVDGISYRRVDYPGIADMEDLDDYLRGSFSDEVAARLLATGGEHPLYREIDGALYVAPSGRSRETDKGEIRAQVEQVGETAYAVNVAVDLLAEDRETVTGIECWSFPYEFVGGRWVFTDFALVY